MVTCEYFYEETAKEALEWIKMGDGSWRHCYDPKLARRLALRARDRRFKELEAAGKQVHKFSLGINYLEMGGEGTPYPEVRVKVSLIGLQIR